MATAGRKTKRTPEVEKIITDALSNGVSRQDACAFARIHVSTFHDWLEHFPEFSEAVTRAETILITRASARLSREIAKDDGDWRAALEVLKRRRKDDWAERTEHTGEGGGNIEIIVRYADGTE